MTEIKTFHITGSAVNDMNGTRKRGGGRRRTVKKEQEGGSANIVRGIEDTSSIARTAGSPNSSTWLKQDTTQPIPPIITIQPSNIPINPNQSAAPTNQYVAAATQQGGTKNIKVELKKKQSAKKVHLNPKKVDAPKSQIGKKNTTRKVRKVSVGIASLHRRMTHAKKVHKKVKEMPIDKLKEDLIRRGLIKSTSKAPESVLRQIAADAEVVAKKAL